MAFSLIAFSIFPIGEAKAWTCTFPFDVFVGIEQDQPTDSELLRITSLQYADHLQTHHDGDVVIFGQFFKTGELPFLHEDQYQEIQAQYWPVSETVEMPNQIEYTYLSAYRFKGQKISDGQLKPFEVSEIDARFKISSNYEGTKDLLPPTETDVIGVLRASHNGKRFELNTSICPTYHRIEPDQLDDLLQCFTDGACEKP